MALAIRHSGGTCEVYDEATGDFVQGPFSSDGIADRWMEEQGPRYEALLRQRATAREEEAAKQEKEKEEAAA